MDNLSITEQSTNPWQPALNVKPLSTSAAIPSIKREDSGNEAWLSAQSSAQEINPAADASKRPRSPSVSSEDSVDWNDERTPSSKPVANTQEAPLAYEEGHVWEEKIIPPVSQDTAQAAEQAAQAESLEQEEGVWGEQQTGVVDAPAPPLPARYGLEEDSGPALPPRRLGIDESTEQTRNFASTSQTDTSLPTSPGTPGSTALRQKKETYEIKKIRWHDAFSSKNPRTSPILVQNANGPCPLLALVNALTLSTPADVNTALVEALSTREQVSLGLLLDAVFDELMSGRRGNAAHALPDVSDLYAFLITLHTGMNVNPAFISSPANPLIDTGAENQGNGPGTFEDTREMKLYGTFSVPLIHGWLPERNTPAWTALLRSAKTYEDAQNLMFHEEVLEEKLQHEGLSFQEQATLEDIATIKAFLDSSATQLTSHGLTTITQAIPSGSVAILFRNDHFSTVYRHPHNNQLLQLVTDMGYAGHDEIVWETLVDTTGLNSQFLSGDFRPVTSAVRPRSQTSSVNSQSASGWTTVSRRGANSSNHQASASTQSIDATLTNSTSNSGNRFESSINQPQSPNIEQEDHDLALALQLQEEEEENHRTELARRRRESQLSQQFIEQQAGTSPSNSAANIPVTSTRGRGGATRVLSTGGRRVSGPGARGAPSSIAGRPAIPPRGRRDPEAGEDAPPPTYEEASTEAAYEPPMNHPSHPASSPMSAVSSNSVAGTSPAQNQRRASAYQVNQAQLGQPVRPPGNRASTGNVVNAIAGRRRNDGYGPGAQQEERNKDCIVM
jgi:hypothetical protein